jgi:hypothetical protein
MRNRNWEVLCVVTSSIVAFTQVAKAETITAEIVNVIPFSPFATLSLNGTDYTGAVGEIVWSGAGEGNPSPYGGTFITYCLDLTESIGENTEYPLTVQTDLTQSPKTDPMTTAKVAEMEELFGQHYHSLSTTDDFQAFQLAIWNIVYDTDTQVDTGEGDFYVVSGIDSNAISEADDWLADAASPSDQAEFSTHQLQSLTGEINVQDQITESTPLPSTAMCGVVLMTCVGLFGWMSRRSTQRKFAVAA